MEEELYFCADCFALLPSADFILEHLCLESFKIKCPECKSRIRITGHKEGYYTGECSQCGAEIIWGETLPPTLRPESIPAKGEKDGR